MGLLARVDPRRDLSFNLLIHQRVSLLDLLVHEILGFRVDLHLHLSADLLAFDHLRDLVVVLVVDDFKLLFELLLLGHLLGDPHLRHLELGLDLLGFRHLVQLERSASALCLEVDRNVVEHYGLLLTFTQLLLHFLRDALRWDVFGVKNLVFALGKVGHHL